MAAQRDEPDTGRTPPKFKLRQDWIIVILGVELAVISFLIGWLISAPR